MPDRRPPRGLLDTSVVLDLEHIEPGRLPIEVAVSAITMAELAAGPHATPDPEERARRQDRLQRAEAAFDPLPFDAEASSAEKGGRPITPARWRSFFSRVRRKRPSWYLQIVLRDKPAALASSVLLV